MNTKLESLNNLKFKVIETSKLQNITGGGTPTGGGSIELESKTRTLSDGTIQTSTHYYDWGKDDCDDRGTVLYLDTGDHWTEWA